METLGLKSARDLGAGVGYSNWLSYPACVFLTALAGGILEERPLWTIAWSLALLVVGSPRVWAGRRLKEAQPSNVDQLLVLNGVLIYTQGLAWSGFSSGTILLYGESWTSLCCLMTSLGIITASTSRLYPRQRVLLVFMFSTALPPSLALMVVSGVPMTLLCMLFILFVARSGVENHKRYIALLSANKKMESLKEEERIQRERIALIEERWNLALQGVGDGVFDWLGEEQLLLSVRLREMLSLKREARSLEDLLQSVDDSSREQLQRAWTDCVEGRESALNVEFQIQGHWHLMRGKVVKRDPDGRTLRLVGTCSDIDARKKLQAELSLARNLESMGELSAGLAHEINTPVQYVGDNVRFFQLSFETFQEIIEHLLENKELNEELTEELDYLLEEMPQCIEQSRNGLKHITQIIGAMKQFTHNSQGRKVLVDLNEIIQTSLTLSQNRWKYSSTIEKELQTLSPLMALHGELSQVVLNLIVNAADAIEERKNLEPSHQGKIHISTSENQNSVQLCIRDNGIGIKKQHQEKVFGPFFTTKPVGKGTGQGLTICHSAIENHGGSIRFDSQEGKGTSFYVTLPKCG